MWTPAQVAERKHRFKRLLAVLVPLIILLISAMSVIPIQRVRSDAISKARLQASFLSAAVKDDVEGTLRSIACASEMTKQRIEKEWDLAILPGLQRQISKYAPALRDISVIGPDGRLQASSSREDRRPLDLSGRNFFRVHRDDPGLGLQIGNPAKGPVLDGVTIPVTRRLDKDGKFAGVLVFSLDPDWALEMRNQVDLGKTGTIKLIGTDGILYAGYTPLSGDLAREEIGAPAAAGDRFEKEHFFSGTYTGKGAGDNIERIYYWRRFTDFPLVALVGLGKAEALADTNGLAILISSLGLLSIGVILIKTFMLNSEISRRIKHAYILERHRHRLRLSNVKLAAAKREAEEANKSKTIFLANIGHELRTPLNAIIGFSEIIQQQIFGNDAPRYVQYAADIHQSGVHLLNVVRGLLDLSKIEAGKYELWDSDFKLSEVARECLRIVKSHAESRGVHLRTPPTAQNIHLHADETALKQITINLLSNAIKFTPPGGTVNLSASLKADGGLSLKVTDTGIGMTREEIQEALEPFRQVRNRQHSGEGTGLGLPLAAELAKLHGGSLTIESTPDRGTAVTVNIPAWRVSSRGGDTHAATPQAVR